MKNSEIKSLSIDELHERISSEKENLQKLKFAHAISPIENPVKIKQTKKLIARMYTELTAKQKIEN
ncbi:MAG: 50S ribosomal protein L29 [Cyclobacteriaceae bacterium]|nr:50S ribosomal protein L29 [Cyclobacteriaceae bacterium]